MEKVSIRMSPHFIAMSGTSIKCPNCHSEISVDEVLKHQLEESIKLEFKHEIEEQREEDRKKLVAWKEEQKKQLAEKEQALRLSLTEQLQKDLTAASLQETKTLKEQILQKNKQLEDSRSRELNLLKKEEELEHKAKEVELTLQRQLAEERQKIWAKAEAESTEKHLLKEREQQQVIESLKKSLEEAQRKATQGSQQLQGEVQELELEHVLKQEFPLDEILPVAKGVNGADVTQRVRDSSGRLCGTIVWESKRTKNWSDGWISKLKDDCQLAKGDLAVLVTAVLPDGIKNFGFKEGIYVTGFDCLLSVARILRMVIIKEQTIKLSVVGKNEKMEVLYNYLSGNEFRQRIEAIVAGFSSMKDDLEQEKRAFARIWAKREKEIDRVINNTVGMHGDLEALMGSSLPQIKGLELDNFEVVGTSRVMMSNDNKTVIQTEFLASNDEAVIATEDLTEI